MFFGRSDHCHQWFYDGFLMLLPSLSMVFDGSGPLVKRCDGFDGSLWSRLEHWSVQSIRRIRLFHGQVIKDEEVEKDVLPVFR